MVDGASYALATPIWGLLLDKGLDSRAALILGSGIICLSYLGLGPIPPLTPSITQVGVNSHIFRNLDKNIKELINLKCQGAGKHSASREESIF